MSRASVVASSYLRLRTLVGELVGDLLAHFLERLGRRGLLVDHLDDVEAILRLHEVADAAGRQRERHVLELLHHPAAPEVIEVAAVLRTGLVLRELRGERGEVAPGAHLLQQGLGLRLHRRFVLAFGVQQDVARAHLLGRRVLLLVLLVLAFDSPGGTTTFAFIASASTSRYRIFRFSGSRYCSLCLSNAALTSAIGDRDVLLHGVRREDDHLQLHLFVALAVLALEFRVRHRHPVGHGGAQLFDEQGAPEVLLELLGRERGPLHPQHLLVYLLPANWPFCWNAGMT